MAKKPLPPRAPKGPVMSRRRFLRHAAVGFGATLLAGTGLWAVARKLGWLAERKLERRPPRLRIWYPNHLQPETAERLQTAARVVQALDKGLLDKLSGQEIKFHVSENLREDIRGTFLEGFFKSMDLDAFTMATKGEDGRLEIHSYFDQSVFGNVARTSGTMAHELFNATQMLEHLGEPETHALHVTYERRAFAYSVGFLERFIGRCREEALRDPSDPANQRLLQELEAELAKEREKLRSWLNTPLR